MPRRFWLVGLLMMLVLGACGGGGPSSAPPALDLPALSLHTCLRGEPDHDGPCTDEALATCPPDLTRAACLEEALLQIEAAETWTPADPGEDGPSSLLIFAVVAPLTFAFFGLVGMQIVRKDSQRDEEEFMAVAPVLERLGFKPSAPDSLPPVPIGGKVRRLLLHPGSPPVWLLETATLQRALNGAGAARQALIDTGSTLPIGVLLPCAEESERYRGGLVGTTLGDAAIEHLDALYPNVGLQSSGSLVLVTPITPVRSIRGKRSDVSLDQLAETALAVAASIDSGQA